MGQHLQLYASKNIDLPSAKAWCHDRLMSHEASMDDEAPPAILRVDDEMRRIDRHSKADHLEHWSSDHGVSCFKMFDHEAYLCDDNMVATAIAAGAAYNGFAKRLWPDRAVSKIDWSNDDVIDFLRSHLGYVVWGYNDGI